jgi:hypothetical protein
MEAKNNSPENRKSIWEKTEKRLDSKLDPIEPKIVNLVVALNAIGLSTAMSCEGHCRSGVLRNDSTGKFDTIKWNGPWVAFDLLDNNKILQKKDKLKNLISEFYDTRDIETNNEVHVYLTPYGTGFLNWGISVGTQNKIVDAEKTIAELEKSADDSLKKQQKEILEFSNFLKEKYLKTGFQI